MRGTRKAINNLSLCKNIIRKAPCQSSIKHLYASRVQKMIRLKKLKKKKSLLLNCEGIFRSGDICLFVNLATVLNKNLESCFGYYL